MALSKRKASAKDKAQIVICHHLGQAIEFVSGSFGLLNPLCWLLLSFARSVPRKGVAGFVPHGDDEPVDDRANAGGLLLHARVQTIVFAEKLASSAFHSEHN